jgi:hypothetical protein
MSPDVLYDKEKNIEHDSDILNFNWEVLDVPSAEKNILLHVTGPVPCIIESSSAES